MNAVKMAAIVLIAAGVLGQVGGMAVSVTPRTPTRPSWVQLELSVKDKETVNVPGVSWHRARSQLAECSCSSGGKKRVKHVTWSSGPDGRRGGNQRHEARDGVVADCRLRRERAERGAGGRHGGVRQAGAPRADERAPFHIDDLWLKVTPDTEFHRWLSQGIDRDVTITLTANADRFADVRTCASYPGG